MSAAVATPSSESVSGALRHVVVVSKKGPIAFTAVTALMALLLVFQPREGDVKYRLGAEGDALRLPDLALPGMAVAWVCLAVAAAAMAGSSIAVVINSLRLRSIVV